ncbi:MAG: peptidoglycan DD-metalloendopeptidase family protein [Terrimonas sp.]|nr:peptidoglycan DD-metalloendopeptidase family protein [Terrimonas sp.]
MPVHKIIKKVPGFFLFCLIAANVIAQAPRAADYPKNYFRNPLSIPMSLSANFGELRANHWHMGLDIRTNRQVNLPVYAAADGYIARVSVQAFGFGQAIYINHPNGLTTVYGHLNAFFPALAAYIEKQQYQKESWNIDITFTPGQFPVKKGQEIARSGSTGGSQGPHLHFEIRNTQTEKCLNPLLFGFADDDKIPPVIGRLAIYDRERSLYEQSPRLITVSKSSAYKYITNPQVIETGDNRVSFAINATDRTNISSGPNGIYGAKICMDDKLLSAFKLDDIGYDETLYLNAQIDYRYKNKGGIYLQHLSKLPGDNGPAYILRDDRGLIVLNDSLRHKMEIEVKDANGNSAVLNFELVYKPGLKKDRAVTGEEKFPPGFVSVFERDDFEAFIKEGTLYDTIHPDFAATETTTTGAASARFHLNDASIPVHQHFAVRIKPDVVLADKEKNRILILRESGKSKSVDKARWEAGWLTASAGNFGDFQAFLDTVPPALNSIGKGDTLDLSRSSTIVFRPTDNFDVIRNFRAELDGKWLMFSNDKGRSFIYRFDEHFPYGVHRLTVRVEDLAGNTTVRSWWLKRNRNSTAPVRKKAVPAKKKN